MSEIREIKKGSEIGRINKSRSAKYVWHACIDCGKERWVTLRKGLPENVFCNKCKYKGARAPSWKGGRIKTKDGYVEVKLQPDDFFYPMTTKRRGYLLEHRLVMAKHLGRSLHSWEIIHHKNHLKDDNRIENLQLVTDDRHKQITILENRIAFLEKRVLLLEVENIRLEQSSCAEEHGLGSHNGE